MVMHARKVPRFNDGYYEKKGSSHLHYEETVNRYSSPKSYAHQSTNNSHHHSLNPDYLDRKRKLSPPSYESSSESLTPDRNFSPYSRNSQHQYKEYGNSKEFGKDYNSKDYNSKDYGSKDYGKDYGKEFGKDYKPDYKQRASNKKLRGSSSRKEFKSRSRSRDRSLEKYGIENRIKDKRNLYRDSRYRERSPEPKRPYYERESSYHREREYKDYRKDKYYYQQPPPAAYLSSSKDRTGLNDKRYYESTSSTSYHHQHTSSSKDKERKFGDWTECLSSSGKKYYYNARTGVSQWEKPKDWPTGEYHSSSYEPSAHKDQLPSTVSRKEGSYDKYEKYDKYDKYDKYENSRYEKYDKYDRFDRYPEKSFDKFDRYPSKQKRSINDELEYGNSKRIERESSSSSSNQPLYSNKSSSQGKYDFETSGFANKNKWQKEDNQHHRLNESGKHLGASSARHPPNEDDDEPYSYSPPLPESSHPKKNLQQSIAPHHHHHHSKNNLTNSNSTHQLHTGGLQPPNDECSRSSFANEPNSQPPDNLTDKNNSLIKCLNSSELSSPSQSSKLQKIISQFANLNGLPDLKELPPHEALRTIQQALQLTTQAKKHSSTSSNLKSQKSIDSNSSFNTPVINSNSLNESPAQSSALTRQQQNAIKEHLNQYLNQYVKSHHPQNAYNHHHHPQSSSAHHSSTVSSHYHPNSQLQQQLNSHQSARQQQIGNNSAGLSSQTNCSSQQQNLHSVDGIRNELDNLFVNKNNWAQSPNSDCTNSTTGSESSTESSVSLVKNKSSSPKPTVPTLTPSLSKYFKQELIAHVTNWESEALEKQVSFVACLFESGF